jgi:hypothetical protein
MTEGYWLKGSTCINIHSESHISAVIRNPSRYGIATDLARFVLDQNEGADDSNDLLIGKVLSDGWIKIRHFIGHDVDHWTIVFAEHTKSKMEIVQFLRNALLETSVVRSDASLTLEGLEDRFYREYDQQGGGCKKYLNGSTESVRKGNRMKDVITLNSIVENVLNQHARDILSISGKARTSNGLWRTRDISLSLMKKDNYRKVDFDTLLSNLFEQTEKHLKVLYSPKSRKRGLRRGFVPVGKKAIEEATRGRKLEVPLERALALKNGWCCQFAPLSGFNNDPNTYKRKSIDLLVESSEEEGFLVELKEWGARDNILFAAIEVIVNWYCFIIVRRIDMQSDNLPRRWWPTYRRFNLRIMAPEDYFKRHPNGELGLVDSLKTALAGLSKRLDHKYGVDYCDIAATQLNISEEEFKTFVANNSDALTRWESKPADLVGSAFLCVKL